MEFCMYPRKYKPSSLDEMILDPQLKKKLEDIIKKVPNTILYGPPGVGKSCFVEILLKETGFDHLKINASDENSVDTIRTKLKTFALSAGFTPLKIIYLNEGDNFKIDAENILRMLIEEVEEHTRFIITCNYPERFSAPIFSRFQEVEFKNPPATKIFERCLEIVEKEKVKIKDKNEFKKSLLTLVKRLYPDMRRIFNALECSVINGEIESLQIGSSDIIHEKILSKLLDKDIDSVREIIRSESIYYPALFQFFFDNVTKFSDPGEAVLIIGNAYRWDSQVSIKEINFLTMCVELFKKAV